MGIFNLFQQTSSSTSVKRSRRIRKRERRMNHDLDDHDIAWDDLGGLPKETRREKTVIVHTYKKRARWSRALFSKQRRERRMNHDDDVPDKEKQIVWCDI